MRYLDDRRRHRHNDNWMMDVDRIFDDFFSNGLTTEFETKKFTPTVDIQEGNDCYLISADLPGMREEDISVEVKDRVLTISGERNYEKKEEEQGRFHRFERGYGQFSRSFQLPDSIDESKVQANYENGVLEVLIPRSEVAKTKSIKVQAGKGGLFKNLLGKTEKKDIN